MLAIALRPVSDRERPQAGRVLAAIGAPVLVALWVAAWRVSCRGLTGSSRWR